MTYPQGDGRAPGEPGPTPEPPPWQRPPEGQPAWQSQPGQYGHPGQQGAPPAGPGWSQHGTYPHAGGPPQPPKTSSRKLLLGLGGGLLALVLIVVLGVVFVTTNARNAEEEAAAAAQARDEAITAPVAGYLQALADGDAETALSFVSSPSPTELMTDEVLAVSNEIAPITAIDVPAVDGESGYGYWDVPATYLLGDTEVSTVFSVTGPVDAEDEGDYEVTSPFGYLYAGEQLVAVGAAVNGVPVTAADVEVFPGVYEVTLEHEMFALEGELTAPVTAQYESGRFEPEVVMTDAGLTTFRDLVIADVEECIASTDLDAGCGLDLPETLDDGAELVDGTVTRELTASAQATLDSLDATTDYSDPMIVTGEYIGSVDTEADCTKDGQDGRCEIWLGPSLGGPVVDFGADEPAVRWD
ncbi:hypothetical protein [Ruania halotolerans]|uniref:hypothetical protein n=1 Tax=Ruania halotolerans TaxID=2897773 RepID=UPI001E5E90AD|nr:hypothetical protein [Ruania halotolerans]UFU05883.1 hypothetical protein LQF10_15845 [Ruania halotolerans]